MRALVKTESGPGLRLQEVPEPVPGPDDVLVRVLRAGLCGTDLHLEQWDDWAAATVRPPLIIGHEFSGEVAAVGANVTNVSVGKRVSGEGHVICGVCRNCRAGRRQLCIRTSSLGVNRNGAFADYVVLPATNVWVQPDDLDLSVCAVFDPLGNATHTTLAFPMPGEDVLITGAGPIGIMSAAIAQHIGARYVVVTDVSDYRLGLARRAGADAVVNVSTRRVADVQRDLGMREGFDIGLEMSGNPSAVREMIANMNHGGRIAMLGLPSGEYAIDWGPVITRMLTIRGIYGREMYDTWYAMSALLQSSSTLLDAVRSVITHTFPAEDWQTAFDTARSGRCGKVLMDWS
ncbi:L-threonine 3-dehydrogenase [Branchiibius cervicis]|uniref:L-threonine 3-dehydrogenase n=1 Tax=Branchiibius cervicis TaxID=908252 RepID=A0ABW2ARQ3_9MICO